MPPVTVVFVNDKGGPDVVVRPAQLPAPGRPRDSPRPAAEVPDFLEATHEPEEPVTSRPATKPRPRRRTIRRRKARPVRRQSRA